MHGLKGQRVLMRIHIGEREKYEGKPLYEQIVQLSLDTSAISPEVRFFLTTGFCGGFTTMSTFSYENFALLQDGEHLLAFANTGVTFAACLGAVWLGSVIARAL